MSSNKKTIAGSVFASMTEQQNPRKEIIAEMIVQAGLTTAGAATYYNNFRTGVWTAVKTEQIDTPVVDTITPAQLQTLWSGIRVEDPDTNQP